MIGVVIPSRERDDMLIPLVRHLAGDNTSIIVMDNGMPDAGRLVLDRIIADGERVARCRAVGSSIYRMWNDGWTLAIAFGCSEVCFLNDDAWIAADTLDVLARELRRDPKNGIIYPDWTRGATYERVETGAIAVETHGTYRHGGMCGWCFMVPVELAQRFDEQYEWWAGDDDFAFQVEDAGYRQLRHLGRGVEHHGEATAHLHSWTHDAKSRDLQRLQQKWGTR